MSTTFPQHYDDSANDTGETIDSQTVTALQQTRPWVIFLSVLGFIGSAFMGLGTVIIAAMGSQMPGMPGGAILVVGIYAIGALIVFYLSLCLWRYGARIGDFAASRHVAHLNAALVAQKTYWKILGIIMAVYIGFLVLMMFLSAGAAMSQQP